MTSSSRRSASPARRPPGPISSGSPQPKPIVPPGTPFPAGSTDLQSWMRDDPPLAPDWLRIGTDILKQGTAPTFTTFNASFKLKGKIHAPKYNGLTSDAIAHGETLTDAEPSRREPSAVFGTRQIP